MINTIKNDGLGNLIGVIEDTNSAGLPTVDQAEVPPGTVRQPSRSSLTDFIAGIKRGVARNNRYLVTIPLGYGNASEIASLFCESVSLPGLSVATTPHRIYGEQHEVPYERMFDPVTFTFYVDGGMVIKKAFDDWMISIINPLTRTQSYYENYIRDVKIEVYNVDDSIPYEVTLFKAYPKSVQAVQLDANGKDIMKLTVTLVYKFWQSKDITTQVEADRTKIINSGTVQDPFEVFTNEGFNFDDYYSNVDIMGNRIF